jgi:hypothetical protein
MLIDAVDVQWCETLVSRDVADGFLGFFFSVLLAL